MGLIGVFIKIGLAGSCSVESYNMKEFSTFLNSKIMNAQGNERRVFSNKYFTSVNKCLTNYNNDIVFNSVSLIDKIRFIVNVIFVSLAVYFFHHLDNDIDNLTRLIFYSVLGTMIVILSIHRYSIKRKQLECVRNWSHEFNV